MAYLQEPKETSGPWTEMTAGLEEKWTDSYSPKEEVERIKAGRGSKL